MEIEVANETITRIVDDYRKNGMVTKKDVPDLDCKYLGNHLEKAISKVDEDVHYKGLYPSKVMDCFGVLYNGKEYNDRGLMNRIKKMKI